MSSSLPVLDPDSIRELRSAGDDFLAEMLGLLVETGSAQLAEIAAAVAAGDTATVAAAAHSLKGAASGVGASQLVAACAAIERAAAGSSAELPALLANATECMNRVRKAADELGE